MTARRRPAVDRAAQAIGEFLRDRRRASMGWLLECDISMAQIHVVTTLHQQGALTVGGLAEALGISAPSVTGLVDRLVERGLVERVRAEDDRRTVRVSLSADGQALTQRMHGVKVSELHDVLGELSDAELADVVRLAARLREVMDARAERRPAAAGLPRLDERRPA
ncbi:MAG TPA: MarR family transcriptional regulator [Candidatus Dormibacteraeota bacterium]|jgi:DNA-binding MarR family transcriptional regulator|nr:MarR family transcriptional regulator [Candidatus Dormibacteraeota bacterium]